MIQAHIEDNDLIITGEITKGDIYHGLCCPGYDFTVATVIVSAWGHCDGPHRPENPGDENDPYLHVRAFDTEDIGLFLTEDLPSGPLTLPAGAGGMEETK